MKALILAGGRGKRLGKVSEGTNKCMLKVYGKPLIEYSFDAASSLKEITEIVVVAGYRAEDIINTYGNNYRGTRIRYAFQWEPHGLVDALEWASQALDGSDFMLMLGDEFMAKPRHKEMLAKFNNEKLFGVCGVIEVDNPELISKTYTITQDADNKITKLIEKPLKPFNKFMGSGNCVFKNELLSFIKKTPVNLNRSEKELPDLIQCAIEAGNTVKSFIICEKYVNVNSTGELDELNSYFAHL